MSFNFPNSPTPGQIFQPPGGVKYVWTDGAWRVVDSLAVLNTADTRNRIVNGAMQISQENAGNQVAASAVNGGYRTADQWVTTWNTATASIRAGSYPNTGPGNSPYAYINVVTAQASLTTTHYAMIQQTLEGINIRDFLWGTANARQVVLTFWVYATAATGTFCVRIANSDWTRSYIATYTIPTAGVWQKVTLIIPGDTAGAGTWPETNVRSMSVHFNFGAGPTYQGVPGWQAGNFYGTAGMTNGVATVGQFFITNVGLYLDPDNTGVPPRWQMPDEAEELRACERYFQKSYRLSVLGGAVEGDGAEYSSCNCSTSSTDWNFLKFRTRMRASAAVTLYPTTAPATSGSISVNAVTKPGQSTNSCDTGAWMRANAATGITAGLGSVSYHWLANARM